MLAGSGVGNFGIGAAKSYYFLNSLSVFEEVEFLSEYLGQGLGVADKKYMVSDT